MANILIIEDEIAIAELEKDYLELSGFQVTMINEGNKGLLEALSGDFQLVILDFSKDIVLHIVASPPKGIARTTHSRLGYSI